MLVVCYCISGAAQLCKSKHQQCHAFASRHAALLQAMTQSCNGSSHLRNQQHLLQAVDGELCCALAAARAAPALKRLNTVPKTQQHALAAAACACSLLHSRAPCLPLLQNTRTAQAMGGRMLQAARNNRMQQPRVCQKPVHAVQRSTARHSLLHSRFSPHPTPITTTTHSRTLKLQCMVQHGTLHSHLHC